MTTIKFFSTAIAFVFFFALSTTTISAQSMDKTMTHKMEKTTLKTITLEQTPGEFSIQSLVLAPGEYQFSIANNGVDHEVGFVLVPKGKYAPDHHIKAAYVQAPVKEGTASLTQVVTLEKGQYEYFCPLNPTEKYELVVK